MKSSKREFLFRCDRCQIIISMEFEDVEDIESVLEDKIFLECPCGGKCYVLRD